MDRVQAKLDAVEFIRLCQDTILATQEIPTSKLTETGVERLEDIQKRMIGIIHYMGKKEQVMSDNYERDTLIRYLSDLKDKDLPRIRGDIEKTQHEEHSKKLELESAKEHARLTTNIDMGILIARAQLIAIHHAANKGLLEEDGKEAIKNALGHIDKVNRLFEIPDMERALKALAEIGPELGKVHFKRIPRITLRHDHQLVSDDSPDSPDLSSNSNGQPDQNLRHDQPRAGHISAFEIINSCQDVIEDVEAIRFGAPSLSSEHRTKIESIKRNMRVIMKDRVAHVKTDTYELNTLKEYLDEVQTEDFEMLNIALTETQADIDKSKDGEKIDPIIRALAPTLIVNYVEKIPLKLMIIVVGSKKGTIKLMGNGQEVIETAIEDWKEVRKLVNQNDLIKAAEHVNKIKDEVVKVCSEGIEGGDLEYTAPV